MKKGGSGKEKTQQPLMYKKKMKILPIIPECLQLIEEEEEQIKKEK